MPPPGEEQTNEKERSDLEMIKQLQLIRSRLLCQVSLEPSSKNVNKLIHVTYIFIIKQKIGHHKFHANKNGLS